LQPRHHREDCQALQTSRLRDRLPAALQRRAAARAGGYHDKGVDLFLHQQVLDTSTTAGKAMFQMLGVFAEFERGIIRERVNAGLARAKAKGTKLGRRPV
jgi:DNA invertase Pin-like site-specific DNA recombinase